MLNHTNIAPQSPTSSFDKVSAFAQSRFGVESLFDHQKQAVEAVLTGRDMFLASPTGSGKTLCFALPSLLMPGTTLVISPLISLIRAQKQKLQSYKIPCLSFDSLQDQDDRADTWHQLQTGSVKILIISPERLSRPGFRERIQDLKLNFVAIDEAHCISQWGFNFRPEYRKLDLYLQDLQRVPRLALTATATAEVRREIIQRLDLRSPVQIQLPPSRQNLSLKSQSHKQVEAQLKSIESAVSKSIGQGIIYAATRRRVEELTLRLSERGHSVSAYHGGLAGPVRGRHQNDFLAGKTRIMVATNSFGMGIDKADIRFVYHYGFSQNIENYVQEIGRAGRDGLPATCILFGGPKDFFIQNFLLERSMPETGLCHTVYQSAVAYLSERRWSDFESLKSSLWHRVNSDIRDLDQALDVLLRESLLLEHSSNSPADFSQERMVTLGAPVDVDKGFWARYEQKRQLSFEKLRAMRDYSRLKKGYEAFLTGYFADPGCG